jgi:hypothetical protein
MAEESSSKKQKPISWSSRKRPLNGLLVAVSALKESSNEASPDTYNHLLSLCQQSGAQTTSQIHKRVKVLIVTPSAVRNGTQRVRKAWKFNLPVVDASWLHACIQQETRIPLDEYRILPPVDDDKKTTTTALWKKTTNSTKKNTNNDVVADRIGDSSLEEKHLDLGCCCICHDAADGHGKKETDCAWCVDCSVNVAVRQHR